MEKNKSLIKKLNIIIILTLILTLINLVPVKAYASISETVPYAIRNVGSGKYLNVYGSRSTNGTNVTVYQRDYTSGQSWTAMKNAAGWYTFLPGSGVSKRLNVYGSTAQNGSRITIWAASGNSTQGWYLSALGGNQYIIRSANNTNLVLTASGTSNSSQVILRPYSSSNTLQRWALETISVGNMFQYMKSNEFPNGKYWTYNPANNSNDGTPSSSYRDGSNGYVGYSNVVKNGGYECYGYANYLAQRIFGKQPAKSGSYYWPRLGPGDNHRNFNGWEAITKESEITSVRPGDIIQVYYGTNSGHTAMVTSFQNGVVQVTEVWGSVDNKINWGYFNGSSSNSTLTAIKNRYITVVLRHP